MKFAAVLPLVAASVQPPYGNFYDIETEWDPNFVTPNGTNQCQYYVDTLIEYYNLFNQATCKPDETFAQFAMNSSRNDNKIHPGEFSLFINFAK